MGYLICDNCEGYYELQDGESPDDFENCQCGGNLKHIAQNKYYSNSKIPVRCSNCAHVNIGGSLSCSQCGTSLDKVREPYGGSASYEHEQLEKEIKSEGKSMIFVGVIQILSFGFLDPLWGVILIIIGVLCFVIVNRIMLVVSSLIVLVAGTFNFFVGGFWSIFAIFQLLIGLKYLYSAINRSAKSPNSN
jgi:ribosomal protein S27E